MTEPVNLRLARKRRDRAAREEQAARNRIVHGRTGAQKAQARAEAEKAARHLDLHRLSPDESQDDA